MQSCRLLFHSDAPSNIPSRDELFSPHSEAFSNVKHPASKIESLSSPRDEIQIRKFPLKPSSRRRQKCFSVCLFPFFIFFPSLAFWAGVDCWVLSRINLRLCGSSFLHSKADDPVESWRELRIAPLHPLTSTFASTPTKTQNSEAFQLWVDEKGLICFMAELIQSDRAREVRWLPPKSTTAY